MNHTTDTLKPIQNSSVSFDYTDKLYNLKFVPEPKRLVKQRIIQMPELDFNPQYIELNKLIADGNLQTQVKENYENVNYYPISSSGYRGYSGLNSRKNGIKQRFFNEKATQFNSTEIATQIIKPKAQKVSEILKIKTSPRSPILEDVEQRPGDSPQHNPIKGNVMDSPVKSPSSGSDGGSSIGNAIWDAHLKDVKNRQRGDAIGEEIWAAHLKDQKDKKRGDEIGEEIWAAYLNDVKTRKR